MNIIDIGKTYGVLNEQHNSILNNKYIRKTKHIEHKYELTRD